MLPWQIQPFTLAKRHPEFISEYGSYQDAPCRGADAIHPGWGFLAENHEFAQRVLDAGLIWIGPSPEVIRLMGDKIAAKEIVQQAGVPTIPGINNVATVNEIIDWMQREDVEYPVMIKAAAGGGGKGMVKSRTWDELPQALAQVRSESKKSFGDDKVLVENISSGDATLKCR